MFYCFVEGSLDEATNHELCIQANYAKAIGCFLKMERGCQSFFNEANKQVDIKGQLIFLRTDYEHVSDAMQCVEL